LLQRGVIKTSITSTTGQLGRNLFEGIFVVELLLIIFITPAFTSGAISNERERKTFDLLHITLLSKAAFVVGKLESALSYVFLLLLAAVPLQSVAFLFGGVGEDELILAFVILATTSVTLGAIGLYFSTTTDRTLTASVRAYTVTAIVTVAAPAVLWFFVNMFNHAVGNTATNITHSPGVETLFIYIGALVVSLNPVLTASATQQLLVNRQEIGFWTATLSNGDKIPMIAPWVSLIIIYFMVSTVVIVLAVRRMQKADQ
jgi:ABC-type transport system involved in multi-copper enzyme maturation permease subunit